MESKFGFTLIESVIVMAVVGILSIIVIIAINNAMSGVQLTSAADKVVSDLRYAQTMANGVGAWYGVSFEVAPGNRYYVYTTTGTIDTPAENPGKRGHSFVTNLGTDFGVTISSVSIAGGRKVEFNPYQTPYNDRTGAVLSTEGVVTLQKDSATRTVRISPNVGRIYNQ